MFLYIFYADIEKYWTSIFSHNIFFTEQRQPRLCYHVHKTKKKEANSRHRGFVLGKRASCAKRNTAPP